MVTVSAAACLTLVVGLSGMLDDAFWTRGNDAAAGDAAGEPVILQVQNDGAMQDLEGAEAEAAKREHRRYRYGQQKNEWFRGRARGR